MNALFELFGTRVCSVPKDIFCYEFQREDGTVVKRRRSDEDKNVRLKEYCDVISYENPDNWYKIIDGNLYVIYDDKNLVDNLNEYILWAGITVEPYTPTGEIGRSFNLHSKRTKDDVSKFVSFLSSINYNDGYGAGQLYGTIVFRDGMWLTRDCGGWWEYHIKPEEPDWSLDTSI